MPASEAQRAANRANAKHSTGPRTPDGKRASSRNASTHRAFCRHLVLDGEDANRFRALRRPFLASLNPQTVAELFLADRAVSLMWRLDRLQAAEEAAYDFRRQDLLDKVNRLPAHDDDDEDHDHEDDDRSNQQAAAAARAQLGGADPVSLIDPPFVLADAYAHADPDNPFERLSKAEHRLNAMLGTTLRRLAALQRQREQRSSNPDDHPTPPCPFLGPDEEDDNKNDNGDNDHHDDRDNLPSDSSLIPQPSSRPTTPHRKSQNEPNPKNARALYQAATRAAGDLLPPPRGARNAP